MSTLRKIKNNKGYSLVEIMLVLSIAIFIISTGVYWANSQYNEVIAASNTQRIMSILKSLSSYTITNAPDGSSQSSNPINNSVLTSNNMLNFSVTTDGNWLYNKELGHFKVSYANDYSSSNVIELDLKNTSLATCDRIVSVLSPTVLEVKIGSSYVPFAISEDSSGNKYYKLNVSKGIDLCKSFISSSDTSQSIIIRYFAAPDIASMYTTGGESATLNSPSEATKQAELKALNQIFTTTYNIRDSHISS